MKALRAHDVLLPTSHPTLLARFGRKVANHSANNDPAILTLREQTLLRALRLKASRIQKMGRDR